MAVSEFTKPRRSNRKTNQSADQERAGLYVRVSMDRSARGMTDEIVSPATQEDRARAYCQSQGWQITQVEHDIDESAYRQHYSKRAGLMRLLEAVRRGGLTKIVVWKFSRLSRRLREFIEICDLVEAAGGGVVSVSEQVDTSTPAGRLIRNILASFAQFQAEEISEQIFESWITRAKSGRRPPGVAPYGTVNNRGMLEPHPETHRCLVAIYEQYVATGSIAAVLDHLTANRVPPPQADTWSVRELKNILINPAYIGHLPWAGEVYAGLWPPVIPVDLWQRAQSVLAERSTGDYNNRRDAHLLTGYVRCAGCGRTMVHHTQASRRVYWCQDKRTGRRHQDCKGPSVVADQLDDAVWDVFIQQLTSPNLVNNIRQAAVGQTPGQDRREDQANRLRQELERYRARVRALFDLVGDGSISRSEFREQNAEYRQRLQDIQAQLAGVEVSNSTMTEVDLTALVNNARQATETADRRVVLTALSTVVVIEDRRIWLDLTRLGLRIRIACARMGEALYCAPEVRRLDYRGPMLTERQWRFLIRCYPWADKHKLAARLGRGYQTLISLARRTRA